MCVSLWSGRQGADSFTAAPHSFQEIGNSSPPNSFWHLHYPSAFKVHFLLCERELFVLFSPRPWLPKVDTILCLSHRKGVQVCSAHRQLIVCPNVFHLHVYNVNSAGVSTVPFIPAFPQGCNCLNGQVRHLFDCSLVVFLEYGEKGEKSVRQKH